MEITEDEKSVLLEEEAVVEVDNLSKKELELLTNSFFQNLWTAFSNARYASPLFALIGIFVAYLVTIAPYHKGSNSMVSTGLFTSEPLNAIRPVLNLNELQSIQLNTMYGETQLWMSENSTIKLRFFTDVSNNGNFRLPDMFYEGVVFGITNENSHSIDFTARRRLQSNELEKDLKKMFPSPTSVLRRSARNNQTGWEENGFAVFFSYEHLKAQGKLAADSLQPWKRVLEDVLSIAREYRQVYITMWYPHSFGTLVDPKDPFRYVNIIQQTLPTRTGLNELKSTVVVWLSAVNSSAPHVASKVYQEDWSPEEPWMKNIEQLY